MGEGQRERERGRETGVLRIDRQRPLASLSSLASLPLLPFFLGAFAHLPGAGSLRSSENTATIAEWRKKMKMKEKRRKIATSRILAARTRLFAAFAFTCRVLVSI